MFAGRRRRMGSLASFLAWPGLTVSLVGRRRRIFPWPGVGGTIGRTRAGGLAGSIGGLGTWPWGRTSAGPWVTLRTNKNTNVSETKQNKAVRRENNKNMKSIIKTNTDTGQNYSLMTAA